MKKQKNTIATIIIVLAIIVFVAFFFMGLSHKEWVYNVYRDEGHYSYAGSYIYWVLGVVCGGILLGFSEIIKLLEKRNNKSQDGVNTEKK